MLKHLVSLTNLKKNFNTFDSIVLVISRILRLENVYLIGLNRTVYFRKKTKDFETFKEIFNQNIYNIKLPIVPHSIVDAGANIGLASLFFKMKFPESEIIALEIEESNIDMIKKNTKNLSNFSLERKALYNNKSFFKIENPYNATNSFVVKEVNETDDYNVKSITLDEILVQKNWETIDLLKIDIEGAEKKLFESNYENWLPKTKIIMVETHDRFIPKCSYTVMNALNDYNFILYTTTEGTLIYYNMTLVEL